MREGVDIGQARQVAERQLLIRKKCARHQRQRGILRAADGDFALKAIAALDPDAVHGGALAADFPPCQRSWSGGLSLRLLQRALQRVLVLAGEVDHLGDLCLGNFVSEDPADGDPLLMHLEHDSRRVLDTH